MPVIRTCEGTVAELPFDPEMMDVVCARVPDGAYDRPVFNVTQAVIHHSPSGLEYGYTGSGPADFALNVLALFLPVGCDGEKPFRCYQGECSATAFRLHQAFKIDFIARLPPEGGTIRGDDIRAWLDRRGVWVGKAMEGKSCP